MAVKVEKTPDKAKNMHTVSGYPNFLQMGTLIKHPKADPTQKHTSHTLSTPYGVVPCILPYM